MYPHRMRLRGPWDCEPLVRLEQNALALPAPFRMMMPCRWADGGLGGFCGCVRFRRKFGYPGRIDAHERVWLTFAGAAERARVALNGVALGNHDAADGGYEHEVTALLRDRNELTVEVEGGENGGLWGDVALEVRCTAFLRNLRCATAVGVDDSAQVQVSGELAGRADEPLELYLLLDRSTVAYAELPAPVVGQAFRLISEWLPHQRWRSPTHKLRVDLVNRATVWYTWEQQLAFEPPIGQRK